MPESIGKLSPSAARLLLAFMSAVPGETYDDMILRSGITSYQTVVKAKRSLADLGFLLYDQKGEEHWCFQRSDVR